MSQTTKIIRYGFFAIIILVIIGLVWWYFFLRAQESALEATDLSRGAGIEPPSFGDMTGSNYGNITANLPTDTDSKIGTSETHAALPQLWQVTRSPVAGAGFFTPLQKSTSLSAATSSAQTGSAVRFVERGTGYVLEANTRTGALTRLTNTLVPRVYEALAGANGAVVLRGVNEAGSIVTSVGLATSTPAPNEEPFALILSELPRDIRTIVLSPSGEEILYILEESAGGASIMRALWNGKNASRVATVGVSGWQLHWLSDKRIILTQNTASGVASSAYELSTSGRLTPLVRGIVGLTFLPKANSSAQLYGSGSFTLSARASTNASAITLPIRTTAAKCVWAPSTELVAYCAVPQTLPGVDALSNWLRGKVHTSDSWWKVDVSAGRVELIYTPSSAVQLDVENPVINPEGTHIVFMNAVDKSLWLLRVSETL